MGDIGQIAERMKNAEAVLITASNGLSISEGLNLFADDQAFNDLFGDFRRTHGIGSILQGVAAPWPTEEERWAFLSRLIQHYCNEYVETGVMRDLKAIVGDKPRFVLTSNGECHFERCGFDADCIFEIEGSWSDMQCATGCTPDLYPLLDLARVMAQEQSDGRVPSELVPRCPHCGGPMHVHVQTNRHFIVDESGPRRLNRFLSRFRDKPMVVLELGIGPANRLIKGPVMDLVRTSPNMTYVTVNLGEVYIPAEIADRSFGIDGRIEDALARIREACGR